MIVGTVCLSHSPLRDRNRAAPDIEQQFNAAVQRAADFVADKAPDLTVILYPDHVNGFSYGLLPPFCVGIEGVSIGDYGTASGKLEIPEAQAADLARSLLKSGVDVAISYDMKVDHGAMQPLEWLSENGHPLFRAIPIFVNCAAPPLPTFERVRALGRAVGDWACETPERVLIIGSGGLSHDPPVPELAKATPEIRKRLIGGEPLTHAQRHHRQSLAHQEGAAMAAGTSALLPANAEWDASLMRAFVNGDLFILDQSNDDEIAATGGRGGHEARTWIAALSATGAGYQATELFCATIDEWITGMGILHAVPA